MSEMTELEIIGQNAGLLWKSLHEKGPATVSELKKRTKLGETEMQRGIGWLAREGKVGFDQQGRSVKLFLL